MRNTARQSRVWILVPITSLLLCLFATNLYAQNKGEIVHVVLLWLHEPGNQEHRQQFINASRRFTQIPGVIDLRIGQPVMSDRSIVDDSFDVGLYVTVADEQALKNYLVHPIHQQAVAIAKPIANKFLVYDFLHTESAN